MIVIKKAVIAAAGLGTRLLPATKELPKEMLPVFSREGNSLCLKPMLQLIFEQLFRNGVKEFCFVVGRGKRSVVDHFTPDWGYVDELGKKGKDELAKDLEAFYRMVEQSTVVWLNQSKPKGFGHAVLLSRPFMGTEPFFVAAGDTYINSKWDDHIRRLMESFDTADASLLLEEVDDPSIYGVAVLEGTRLKSVVEKPRVPPSNYAIMPFYAFRPNIFKALEKTSPGSGGEIQLTDAIQKLVDEGGKVSAVLLREDELTLDIGTPKTYWEAVKASYKWSGVRP